MFNRLPFHFLLCPSGSLPIELWEDIIDLIVAERCYYRWSARWQETLFTCTLVCRTWMTYVNRHRMDRVELSRVSLRKFSDAFKPHSRRLPFINELSVAYSSPWISTFFIQHRHLDINFLRLYGLDLTREHICLHKVINTHSVQCLHLSSIVEAHVARLIRLINCFHSLSSFKIHFESKALKYRGEILPKPSGTTIRALDTFDIQLIPGIFWILDWCLQRDRFLTNIKNLTIRCGEHSEISQFEGCFMNMDRVMQHCGQTLEDLTLHFWKVPVTKSVSHISAYLKIFKLLITKIPQSINLVRLEGLAKLRRLRYCSYVFEDILEYAKTQLEAISPISPHNNLAQVCFDIKPSSDKSSYRRKRLYAALDSTLVRAECFPSLIRVESRETQFFPSLRERGIIAPAPWSYDLDIQCVSPNFDLL